jgi:DNA-binding transcriptional ArsR family regulator
MSRLGAIRAEIKQLEEARETAGARIRELKLEAGEIVLAGDSEEAKAPAKKAAPASESPTDVKVLEFLKTHGESGAADVAAGVGAAESTVRQSLGKLWKLHRVEKPGQGRYTFK